MSGSTDEREYKRSEGGARGFFILVLKLTGTELSTVRTNRNHHGRQYASGVICSTALDVPNFQQMGAGSIPAT